MERIVVAVAGRGAHDDLRARLLGSLGRRKRREVVFVQVVPSTTPEATRRDVERQLVAFAEEETRVQPRALVVARDDVVEALAEIGGPNDLLLLGLQQHGGKRLFGEFAITVARRSDAAILMISRKR